MAKSLQVRMLEGRESCTCVRLTEQERVGVAYACEERCHPLRWVFFLRAACSSARAPFLARSGRFTRVDDRICSAPSACSHDGLNFPEQAYVGARGQATMHHK